MEFKKGDRVMVSQEWFPTMYGSGTNFPAILSPREPYTVRAFDGEHVKLVERPYNNKGVYWKYSQYMQNFITYVELPRLAKPLFSLDELAQAEALIEEMGG